VGLIGRPSTGIPQSYPHVYREKSIGRFGSIRILLPKLELFLDSRVIHDRPPGRHVISRAAIWACVSERNKERWATTM